jgi:protein DGCR14
MFSPDADVSPYHPPALSSRPAEGKGDPKSIKHPNTRLPEQDDSSNSRGLSAPPSPTRSRIDAAITGTPCELNWHLYHSIQLIALPDHPRSPTINHFALVPNLPSPTPSELGPKAVKQLMTWGTLNATPRVLSQSDDPVPPPSTPFHLPAPSSREVISHKLSSNASKSLRAKAGLLGLGPKTPGISRTPAGTRRKGDGSMPPPSWTPRRADVPGSLTPAAKRLLDRTTMGTAAARRAEAMGRMAGWEGSAGKAREKDLNRVRWTPTPSRG